MTSRLGASGLGASGLGASGLTASGATASSVTATGLDSLTAMGLAPAAIGRASLGRRGKLVLGRRARGLASEVAAEFVEMLLLTHIALRRRRAEQLAGLGLVVHDRRQRQVHIRGTVRIVLDAQIDAPQAEIELRPPRLLDQRLPPMARVEQQSRLQPQSRAPVAA